MANQDLRSASLTPLSEGGVYITFSGDYDEPCMYVKIICASSSSLCLKMFPIAHREPLSCFDEAILGIPDYQHISTDMFYAWGPPRFPIYLFQEAITEIERANC